MRILLPLVSLPVVLAACSENELHTIPPPLYATDATLSGQICDPVRQEWLADAIVYTRITNDDGDLLGTAQTVTDTDGKFVLADIASGFTYLVYVQYGSQLIETFTVPDLPAGDTVLDPDPCGGSTDASVAIITGDYDHFEDIEKELGVTGADVINGQTTDELWQFLSSPDHLSQYDVIFFDGGHIEEDVIYDTDGNGADRVAAVKDAVTNYVKAGGVIYATDWSYDVVEQFWPKRIDFVVDNTPDGAQVGEPQQVTADVVDGDMSSAIGTAKVDLDFDLDAWPVMKAVQDNVTTYMTADVKYREGFDEYTVSDAPLMVSFNDGSGTVIYSSWRLGANDKGDALASAKWMLSKY